MEEKITKIDMPESHTKIVLLYLEKLEKMNEEERQTIIRAINFINHPVLFSVKESGIKAF